MKPPLYVYNANSPEKCTSLSVQNLIISDNQFSQIIRECDHGPYFAFFKDLAPCIYRFRGPFRQTGGSSFYVLDCTGLIFTDEQKEITDMVTDHVEQK